MWTHRYRLSRAALSQWGEASIRPPKTPSFRPPFQYHFLPAHTEPKGRNLGKGKSPRRHTARTSPRHPVVWVNVRRKKKEGPSVASSTNGGCSRTKEGDPWIQEECRQGRILPRPAASRASGSFPRRSLSLPPANRGARLSQTGVSRMTPLRPPHPAVAGQGRKLRSAVLVQYCFFVTRCGGAVATGLLRRYPRPARPMSIIVSRGSEGSRVFLQSSYLAFRLK